MHLFINRLSFIFLLSIFSCQSLIAQKSNKKNNYYENLEVHRVHYTTASDAPAPNDSKAATTITPHRTQMTEVDSVLSILSHEYSLYKDARGFRILIYSGSSEQEALKAKDKLRAMQYNASGDTTEIFKNVPLTSTYDAPNFKVLVGDYIDKLLAFQMLCQLKEEFPKALLIPVKDVKLENID